MDAIHDLGGMQGFGPIPMEGDAKDFAALETWEKRMWALSRSGIVKGMTVDWFRHTLERMVPADYLAFPYFKKWCSTYLVLLLDNGDVTLDEVARGHVDVPLPPAAGKTADEILAFNAGAATKFDGPSSSAPAFAVGQAVRTLRLPPPGAHSRLPRYARGVQGTIVAQHGAHVVPERSAEGQHVYQALYTVVFSARELWGGEANPHDDVTLDLWESYLVPA